MNQHKVFSKVLFSCLITVEALVIVSVWGSKLIPEEFLVFLLGTLVSMLLIIWHLLFGKTKGRNEIRRIIGCVFCSAAVLFGLAGLILMQRVENIMHAITEGETEISVRLYVMSSDPAERIEDASDYVFGYVPSYDTENILAAVRNVNDRLNAEVKLKKFSDVFSMVDALYNESVDVIVLASSYVSVIEDLPHYYDFNKQTKCIYEFIGDDIYINQDGATTARDDQSGESFLLYLSGADTRNAKLTKSRSDVNILAAVNPDTKQILLVNTPRDYYIDNPAGGGKKDKLTHCGLYGVQCSAEALSVLYGHPVTYYAQINFGGFQTLINALGGVTVYSDAAFTTRDGYYIRKGENVLNGEQALSYARERKALTGGDIARGENQMRVIEGMIKRLSVGNVIQNYAEILDSIEGMFATNMPKDTIGSLIKMQLSDRADWKITMYAVTGEDGNAYTYSAPGERVYVIYPNVSSVERASEMIGNLLDGTMSET